ncbi:hypothetical protein F5148DRAFT_194325 [Russula earlei]|uniref:Uncharacterized protein n=1 Tax=Russula earlei TaxID=71964 RepID=A0ACC0U608_9AGAM|nr:hypothetical protein F5148DRAFT_194325 [Russula earlei]
MRSAISMKVVLESCSPCAVPQRPTHPLPNRCSSDRIDSHVLRLILISFFVSTKLSPTRCTCKVREKWNLFIVDVRCLKAISDSTNSPSQRLTRPLCITSAASESTSRRCCEERRTSAFSSSPPRVFDLTYMRQIDAGDADASTSKDRVNGLHSDLDPPKLASLAGRSLSTCDRTTSPMDPTTTDGMGCRERVEGWPSARRPTTHQLDVPDDDPDTYKGMYGRPLVALLPPFRSPVERRVAGHRRCAMPCFPPRAGTRSGLGTQPALTLGTCGYSPRRRLEFEFATRFRKRDDQVDGAVD